MTESAPEYFHEVLIKYFGPDLDAAPHISRADVDKLLTDDARRRLRQAERAATEWGRTEISDDVEIVSEHVVLTHGGLLYSARLRRSADAARRAPRRPARAHWALHYLATPREPFDPMVDRVHDTPLDANSAAAVDSRYAHELDFPYPLDGKLRRQLDAGPVLLWT